MASATLPATPGTAKSRNLATGNPGNPSSPSAAKAAKQQVQATPTLSAKATTTPPSPSLHSMGGNNGGSILSFSMQPQEHRLMPLEEDKLFQQLRDCDKIRYEDIHATWSPPFNRTL